MNTEKRMMEATRMVDILLEHCDSLQLGILRNVGRDDEKDMIKKPYSPSLLRWCRAENSAQNANIFIRPFPFNPHPWLVLDDLNSYNADIICSTFQALAVETSFENFQVRLLCNRNLGGDERHTVQKALSAEFLGDPGSTSFDRFGRLAGFANKKVGKDFWTILVAEPDLKLPKFDPSPYLLPPVGGGGVLQGVCFKAKAKQTSIAKTKGNSQSHDDFGHIVGRLRFFLEKGYDWKSEAEKLRVQLAEKAHRKGKDAQKYACRTIDAALKELGLIA